MATAYYIAEKVPEYGPKKYAGVCAHPGCDYRTRYFIYPGQAERPVMAHIANKHLGGE